MLRLRKEGRLGDGVVPPSRAVSLYVTEEALRMFRAGSITWVDIQRWIEIDPELTGYGRLV